MRALRSRQTEKLPEAGTPVAAERLFARPATAEVQTLGKRGLGFLSHPVHLLVSDANARYRTVAVKSHLCCAPLPEGSIVRVSEGLYALSPESCLASLACDVSQTRLMKLGYEFCGSYSLFPSASSGFYKRPPLTDVESIRKHLADLGSIQGAKPASKALRFVLDGSASPMETSCAAFYSMPLRSGGCSLPNPSLNHRIDLSAQAKKLTTRDYFVCDEYWESAKLDVEYDSEQEHSRREQRNSDANRRNVLAVMGITVITLTADQMLEFDSAWKTAQTIAELLHVRIRTKKHDSLDAQRKLHRELFDFPTKKGANRG